MDKELLAQITGLHAEMKSGYDAQIAEIKANGFATPELKTRLEKMEADAASLMARLASVEQKGMAVPSGPTQAKSIGEQFVASASFLDMAQGKSRSAITEVKASFTAPSLVSPQVVQPVGSNIFAYRVRGYLPTIPVSTDLMKVPQETAVPAGAGPKAYGAAGNESTIAITMVDAPIRTVSHFTNAAKELLQDAPAFAAFVDQRMRWGLQGSEEAQLVLGDGTGQNVKGMVPYATVKEFTTETIIDRIGLAIAAGLASGHAPSFVVITPADYGVLMTAKNTQGSYLMGNPAYGFTPTIWGVPVAASPKMTANNFLVGAGSAAAVAERQQVVVSLSYENASNFTAGLVTVMAEQRETLVVYAPGAFITGLLS
jgi:HK97 family phage major capsid protein